MQLSDRNYMVYIHVNKLNGKRYVGVTSQNPRRRWQNGAGYNGTYFGDAVIKYGWGNFEHSVIASELTEAQAFSMEQDLIRKYKSDNADFGYNTAKGGKVVHGSEQRKGALNHKSTAVWQIEPKTGARIRRYESQNIAATELGISRKGITKCCRGDCKTYKGFIWEYADIEFEKPQKYPVGKYPHKKKNVSLVDVDGRHFLFNGVEEASTFTGIRQNNIIRYCLGNRIDGTGRRWCYSATQS